MNADHHERALEVAEEQMRRFPLDDGGYYNAAIAAVRLPAPTRAFAALEGALSSGAEAIDVWENIALYAALFGDDRRLDEAVAHVARIGSGSVALELAEGYAHLARGRWAEAAQAFDSALARGDESCITAGCLATAWQRAGRCDEAERAMLERKALGARLVRICTSTWCPGRLVAERCAPELARQL